MECACCVTREYSPVYPHADMGLPLPSPNGLSMSRRSLTKMLACAAVGGVMLPHAGRAGTGTYGDGSDGPLLNVNGTMLPRDLVFRFLPVLLPIASLHVSSLYGLRTDPIKGYTSMHPGVDFADATGTPVFSTAAGRITHAGPAGGYGNMVEITHGLGYSTRFAHLSGWTVTEGQIIDRVKQVGMVGSTGYSTGHHLHFEIRKGGETMNPIAFLLKANELYKHLT